MKNRGCSYLTKSCLCLSRQSSKLTSSGASERAFIIANDACDTAERIASLDYTGQTHKLHPVAFVLLSSIILALCTPPEESSDWLFAQWGTFCQSRSRYRPGPANSGEREGGRGVPRLYVDLSTKLKGHNRRFECVTRVKNKKKKKKNKEMFKKGWFL